MHLRSGRGLAGGMDGFAWAQQRLRGDARPVGALAAHKLDQGNAQTALRQGSGAVLPRRAAADDDDVIVPAHRGGSSAVWPLAMYCACRLLLNGMLIDHGLT